MTDLSDEAFWEWHKRWMRGEGDESHDGLSAWQECRRRAEKREREAFEAGLHDSLYSDKRMCMTEVEEAWRAYKEKQK